MPLWKVRGGNELNGSLAVQGSKNAVLPIMAASLLGGGVTRLSGCPRLRDVDASMEILRHLGCGVMQNGGEILIDSAGMCENHIPHALMLKMRSSVMFLGAILARWQEMGNNDLFISINISPKDFYFMDVYAELNSIVQEFRVPPSRLRVEITETVMMTDNANRILILSRLKQAGFLVEMDDFGSGYSSLNMLKDMPVDVVKIDMVFLTKTKDSMRSQTILRNVMNMTHDLGILSLTEGVETEDQYQMLSGMGCKLFQGYYFAKPMPVEQFEALFLKNRVPVQ